jgi:phosphate transport system permease protein
MTSSASMLKPTGGAGASPLPRRVGDWLRASLRDGSVIRWTGAAGALIPVAALVFILIILGVKAWPAIGYNGWGFFTGRVWSIGNLYGNPTGSGGVEHLPGAQFGALPSIIGTLGSSAIALVVAVPVSLGTALVIVERLPRGLSSIVGAFLELLAGLPSVVIGLWGGVTFGPFIARDVTPFIARNMPNVPVLSYFRGEVGNGEGMLTSGLVLALMITPIIAATTRDLIRQVPILPREGAIALGMSEFETTRKVTLPWVGGGVIGAVVLGLGRALGETMAVAMTCGAALGSVPTNIYGTMTTIAATVVQTVDGAFQDGTGFALRSLAELCLVLMVITLATNILARLLVRRVSGTALPVGRGL